MFSGCVNAGKLSMLKSVSSMSMLLANAPNPILQDIPTIVHPVEKPFHGPTEQPFLN